MKKIILIVVIVLIGVYAAISFFSDPPAIGENVEESGHGVSAKIKNSIQGILPGDTPAILGRHDEDNPHVVVIEPSPNTMTSDDVLERIENLKDSKEHEGLDFARWALFSENAKYSNEEREQFLEKAVETLSPEEGKMLLNDVLLVGGNPALYDNAIFTVGKKMTPNELKNWVEDFLKRKPSAEAKAAVIDYSASRNLYVK